MQSLAPNLVFRLIRWGRAPRPADPRLFSEAAAGMSALQLWVRWALRLTYWPDARTVIADAQPSAIMYKTECPRGDLNPHALLGH